MNELQEQENQTVMIYATFPNLGEAEAVSATLVSEKLVACANLFPGMISVYRWDEAVQNESEVAAIFKTRQQLADAVAKRIEMLHSYDVPAVVTIPTSGGSEGYCDWVQQMTDADVRQGVAAD